MNNLENPGERRLPAAGERYRHFKGGLYQIVALAKHSETGEQMVVYQALYGEFVIYVRPLAMFMDQVDREKYPGCRQKFRFERAGKSEEESTEVSSEPATRAVAEEDMQKEPENGQTEEETGALAAAQKRHAVLMEFLDADTSAQKLNILRGMRKHIDNKMVHDMAVSLDIGLDEKPLEDQIQDIENCLKTYARFECGRLR